jgi:hypothetical protein
MTNSVAVNDLPLEAELPEEDNVEDQYVAIGKQRSMMPVMQVLTLAALVFIGFQTVNLVAGTQLLLAGYDYNRGLISGQEVDDIYLRTQAMSLPGDFVVTAAVATMLAYLWFNVRAVSNLRAFSLRHVPASPVSVVLWQFAPFLNLVKPYSIMMMLWSRSRERMGEDTEAPALGLWWWCTWLAAILFAALSRGVDIIDAERALIGTMEDIPLRAMGLSLVSTACYVISTLAMLAITWGIARTQRFICKNVSTVEVFS